MNPDEITRLEAIRKLDQDALTSVFDEYAPIIFRYALRLCGSPDEADDIVGHVFSELLKHLQRGLGPRNNLRSYLFQIAYHKVVDHSRVRHRTTPLETISSIENEESIPDHLELYEQDNQLYGLIGKVLNDDQRQIIILRFIEDFSIKETSKITGKSTSNVKVIQNRAIAKLRKKIMQEP